jgi:HEAT repeat protein
MKRTLLLLLLLLLGLAASACGTTSPDAAKKAAGTPVSETIVAAQTRGAAEHDAKLAQAMFEIDRNADRYASMAASSGAEAREKRDLLGRSLETQVALYKKELIVIAGDPSDITRRRVAVKALAFSRDADAVPVLAAALDAKEDAVLLTDATFALARIGSPSTPTEKLVSLLKDLDQDVRSNALLALSRVFDARRDIGASPLDPLQSREALGLIEACLFTPENPLVRANAAAALGALGDPRAVDGLVDLLRDTHPLVRTRTAMALGKLGDPKALMPLVKLIDASPAGTPRSAVLQSAASILEQMGRAPPSSLGEDQRSWERFAKEALGVVGPAK